MTIKFICSGQGLVELLRDKKEIIGLEIGTDVGDTADYFLDQLQNLTLYSVDPYSNYVDWNGNNLINREMIFSNMIHRLQKFENRFIQIRKTSDEAAVIDLKDLKFDFIFIDGIHTYDQVIKDCENYYPLLKKGGLFSGHDYNVIAGVNKAVNEFAEKHKKQVMITYHDVWYWYK